MTNSKAASPTTQSAWSWHMSPRGVRGSNTLSLESSVLCTPSRALLPPAEKRGGEKDSRLTLCHDSVRWWEIQVKPRLSQPSLTGGRLPCIAVQILDTDVQNVDTVSKNNTMPQKKIAMPQKKIAMPQKKIAMPQKKIAMPQKKIAMPQKKIAMPQKKIAMPQKSGCFRRLSPSSQCYFALLRASRPREYIRDR